MAALKTKGVGATTNVRAPRAAGGLARGPGAPNQASLGGAAGFGPC